MNIVCLGPPTLTTAKELVEQLDLSTESGNIPTQRGSSVEFLMDLIERKLFVDSVRVIAYALPIRLSVWWGTLCTWHALDGKPGERQDKALRCVTNWIINPSETHRQAAEELARQTVLEASADCCLRAAASAGSAEDAPAALVPLDPMLAARMVMAGAFLAYTERAESDPEVSYERLVKLGIHIGKGAVPLADAPARA